MHQGQICMTTGRHLVQQRIAEEYTATLAAHADAPAGRQPGHGAGRARADHRRDASATGSTPIVTKSVDAGARLAAGGTYEGLFYRPTVLADVPTDSPAYQEEIFGPVAPVVAFDSLDEAVKLASGHRLRAVARAS